MQEATISYHLPSNVGQTLVELPSSIGQSVAELASWVFFLVLLGELAYGEVQKQKILNFYRGKT